MKRVAVVTATRAEYGLLTPLIRRISDDGELDLDLIATGGHLSENQGMTINEIIKDGFEIAHRIPILEKENTPFGISVTMANAVRGFAECFRDDRPDMLVILGDRTEMLGVASAAMNERIPISHIHGGEVTEGAVDDCVRHAITKMSYLHFTSAEVYRKRVIQLGEDPSRVYNAGSLGAENILNIRKMTEEEVRMNIGIPKGLSYSVVTFHPVTLDSGSAESQVNELCKCMDGHPDLFFVVTGANADSGGNTLNDILIKYVDSHDNAIFVYNLGMIRYISAVKYSSFVMGNSSSGILEAPIIGTPTINIGDRQKGRLIPGSVICCEPEEKAINNAIEIVMSMDRKPTNLYGDGNTSERILNVIRDYLMNKKIDLKKGFFDLPMEGMNSI